MSSVIDYNKAVDTLDEGIMALSLFRSNEEFPSNLREEIIQILEFLKLAEEPQYGDLLFDKRITISKESLDSIHKRMDGISFSAGDIEAAIALLQKTSKPGGADSSEINSLEKLLLQFSHPIWVTSISKKHHGKQS